MSTKTLSQGVYAWLKTKIGTINWYPVFDQNGASNSAFGTYNISNINPQDFTGGSNYGLFNPSIDVVVYNRDYDLLTTAVANLEASHGTFQTFGSTQIYTQVNGPIAGIRYDDTTKFYQAIYTVDLLGTSF